MIPPPRDAVIHQLALEIAFREDWDATIEKRHRLADAITTALLHAQQVQRERDAPYMQHKGNCHSLSEAGAFGTGKSFDCSCGLEGSGGAPNTTNKARDGDAGPCHFPEPSNC